MCEFCSKHKRKKWFLDPDNYSEKMLENKRRMNILQKLAGFGLDYELRDTAEAVRWTKHPLTKDVAKHIINKIASSTHSGQVITLQDALEIIDLSDNHVLFACGCRRLTNNKEKMCCLNFGPMRDINMGVRPKEKMEEVDRYEAKLRLEEWHRQGLFSEVIYAVPPFPLALCNCDAKYCLPVKYRFMYDLRFGLLKGHEIARVDSKRCVGCKECISRCQFGAMFLSPDENKVVIDPTKCFGCGLCSDVCKKNAISMINRQDVPGGKDRW